jgi:hypothetical protein
MVRAIALLERFADQAVIALEDAGLVEQIQDANRHRADSPPTR